MTLRTQTRPIHVGPVQVGGGAPVSVQTMANVPTTDVPAVLAQIRRADDLGCDIFRVAVPDQAAAEALPELSPPCASIPAISAAPTASAPSSRLPVPVSRPSASA